VPEQEPDQQTQDNPSEPEEHWAQTM